jgi:hypothetical protein
MRAVVGTVGLRYLDRPSLRRERRYAELDETKVLTCVQCGDPYRRPWRGSWCCWECQRDWETARAREVERERLEARWAPRSCGSCETPLPAGTTARFCSNACRQKGYRQRLRAVHGSPAP